MREQETIYTIPVNDAFHAEGTLCPLCRLEATTDSNLIEYYLGPSLMEPDVRQTTNEKGFCRDHLTRMYNSQENRLGLGLMLHTHLLAQRERILALLSEAEGSSERKGGLFSRRSQERGAAEIAGDLAAISTSCVICERLAYTMGRYYDVVFWQYFHSSEFAELFDKGPPICLPHLAELVRTAENTLNRSDRKTFFSRLVERQGAKLEALAAEVEWFTLKFDYRNRDKPWGESKTALARAIRTLEGESGLT
ncbi:MAG: DUF6062 family protein [Bacillota bacterium]|nr:DUF6062 family protein [Bacillota bacterium]